MDEIKQIYTIDICFNNAISHFGNSVNALVLYVRLLGLLRQLLQKVLQQMVQPEALAVLQILHHQIGEAVHMARSLQHWLGCQNRAVYLQHLLLKHKELAPRVQNVGLECTAHRSKVVLASYSAINCKALVVEEPSFKQIFHFEPIERRGLENGTNKCK